MTESTHETDAGLLRQILAGNEDAFTSLYRRRQAGVYRFVLHMTGSQAVAEDVTQEVFLALIRQVASYDPDRGSVAAYLYGIARNLIARHFGCRMYVALPDEDEEGVGATIAADDPLHLLARKETVDRVRHAVAGLPPHYREVVILCELQELDYIDAAAAIGCPIGTVRSRLHRARGLLLRHFTEPAPATAHITALKPARCAP